MESIKISRREVINKKLVPQISTAKMYYILMIVPISMIIFAFLVNTPVQIAEGMKHIIVADGTLLTDYFLVGNIGATFFNAGLIMLLNLIILKRLELRPNGVIISALYLVVGFSFVGKNIFNILPLYLGGLAYCKYHGIKYSNVVVINMLSTALSPLTSVLVLNMSTNIVVAIILSTIITGIVGFVMPSISAHLVTAHAGYNLYNMGFAAGLVAIVIYSVLLAFGYTTVNSELAYNQWQSEVFWFFFLIYLIFIVVGYKLNRYSFKGFRGILKHSGRLVTDIVKHSGFGLALINMGVLGMMCLIYIKIMGAVLNGIVIAGMLAVVGYGAFGKHLRNTIPIIMGVTLMSLIVPMDYSTSTIVSAALFGTSLAPIAGEFGVIAGLVVGMVHLLLVTNIGVMHGGMMLYNNGLSAGLIATLFIPTLDAFKREKTDEA